MSIGQRLKQVRSEIRGWSQDDLAQHSGVSKTQISNCENEKRGLGADALINLSSALGVSPRWLQHGDGPIFEGQELQSELQHAVGFLRGQLPDDFLDDMLHTEFYRGAQWSRDQLVPMIREAYAMRSRDSDDTDELI
jgi:transcriptional regulator with XRE-family HTH domain